MFGARSLNIRLGLGQKSALQGRAWPKGHTVRELGASLEPNSLIRCRLVVTTDRSVRVLRWERNTTSIGRPLWWG